MQPLDNKMRKDQSVDEMVNMCSMKSTAVVSFMGNTKQLIFIEDVSKSKVASKFQQSPYQVQRITKTFNLIYTKNC